jgi:hypothetical protein
MTIKSVLGGIQGFLGKAAGLAIAAAIAAVSLTMVYQYGASRTDGSHLHADVIMGMIGALAVIYSMGVLLYRRGKSKIMQIALTLGIFVSEGVIMFYELGWISQNVMVAEANQKIAQIGNTVKLAEVERAQGILANLASNRTEGQVLSEINIALARTIETRPGVRKTLDLLTDGCTRRASSYYSQCDGVLKLRSEIEAIRQVEKAKIDVGTVTLIQAPKPVDAAAEMASRFSGGKIGPDFFGLFIIATGLVFMMLGRVTWLPNVFSGRDAAHSPQSGQGMAALAVMGDTRPPVAANDDPGISIVRPASSLSSVPLKKALAKAPEPEKKTELAGSTAEAVLGLVSVEMQKAAPELHPQPLGSVEGFYKSCTRQSRHSLATAGEFYAAYQDWCAERGFKAMPMAEFSAASRNANFIKRADSKRNGRVMYAGRALIPRVVRSSGVQGGTAIAVAA